MLPSIATLTISLIAAGPTAPDVPPTPVDPFAIGRPVPDLVLPSADDGRPRSLAEFRGKKYVLHVFASW